MYGVPFAFKYTPFRPKVKIFLAVKIFFYLLSFSTSALASPIFALHDVNIIANKTNAASVSISFHITVREPVCMLAGAQATTRYSGV